MTTAGQPFYPWTPTAINMATASAVVNSVTSLNVTGSGLGVNTSGSADSQAFINQPATGNIELIAYVSNQTGSDPYAVAGLMVADSQTSSTPQCALVGVSPSNGVNFWYRTADGATANISMGPSLAAPIWLRLIVSQSSVVGYQSSDGVSWSLVGSATMTLPANFFAGFAVSSNSTSATNTASFTNFLFMTNVPQRIGNLIWNWTQTSIGSASGSYGSGPGGVYTIGGSGTGISGTSDQLYFVNQPASGNMTFTAYLESQSSTTLGAVAGIMVSDLYSTNPAESQCAFIGVSPINASPPPVGGVNFFSRLSDGATASASQTYPSGGSSVTPGVWLRLVVSALAVAGYSSSDGVNWQPVGSAAMTMPTNYFVGFAVCNGGSGINNSATFSQASALSTSSLLTWLRADVGVVYTSGGSQPISQWNDQSGNAFNATQSTSGNQPTLVNSGINGLPAINFDSADSQFLQLPAGYANFSGATIFMVAQLANTLSYGQHLLDLSGTPANDYNIGVEIGNASGVPVGQFFVYSASGTGPTTVGQNVAIGTDGQLIEAVHNGVNASLFTNSRISGTNATMNSIANPTSPATRNLNFIGQDANGDSASYFNGQIAEILIYGALIDPTTRQSVEAYLLNKYNLL